MKPFVTTTQPIVPSPKTAPKLSETPVLRIPETPAEYLKAYPTVPEPDPNQPSEILMAAAVLRRTADRMTAEKTWVQGTSCRDVTPRWQVALTKTLPQPLRRLLPERRIGRCSVNGIFYSACDTTIVPKHITPGAITLLATDAMSHYLRRHELNRDGNIVVYNDANGRTLREITTAMRGAAHELEEQAARNRSAPVPARTPVDSRR